MGSLRHTNKDRLLGHLRLSFECGRIQKYKNKAALEGKDSVLKDGRLLTKNATPAAGLSPCGARRVVVVVIRETKKQQGWVVRTLTMLPSTIYTILIFPTLQFVI